MNKNVDYIIVGQGLAGTILSHVLIRNGRKIHVFDEERVHTSSLVAAGLYNPITGRKMVKTWNADKLFPMIEPFYREMEQATQSSFLRPIPIYRPFVSVAEQNEWQEKCADTSFNPYIKSIATESQFPEVNDPFGGIVLNYSGYVAIPQMLEAMRSFLTASESLSREGFAAEDLKVQGDYVHYRGIKATKVVFCTGILVNSLFNFLPFRPVKGEILEISCQLDINRIINRGVFVIPLGGSRFKIGATYNWKDLSTEVTEGGRKYLMEKFNKLVNKSVEILGEKAGIRPATLDRRPFIGLHPEMPQIGIFNGFGTKGISLAPYYANQFVRSLEFGEELGFRSEYQEVFFVILTGLSMIGSKALRGVGLIALALLMTMTTTDKLWAQATKEVFGEKPCSAQEPGMEVF